MEKPVSGQTVVSASSECKKLSLSHGKIDDHNIHRRKREREREREKGHEVSINTQAKRVTHKFYSFRGPRQ